MEEQLRISTLGRLSFHLGEDRIDGFISKKAQALLTYLVCTGQTHSRESMASFFWRGYYRDRRSANLRVVLSNLHKLFPLHCKITRYEISLKKDSSIWLDVAILKEAIRTTRGRYPNLKAEELTIVEDAIDLYNGEFLHGFYVQNCEPFQVWVTVERQRLLQFVLEGLEGVISHFLQRKQFFSGVARSRKYLRYNPANESILRGLMYMLCQTGQRNAAIKQCEDSLGHLEADLGITPEPETIALCKGIRDGKPLTHEDFIGY